jgi:tetratricopeptide (TPR) repeat protein
MSDFSQKRLRVWMVALMILAVGVYAVFRYVQPPERSEFTQKDLAQGLIRAGRAATDAPAPVYLPIDIKRPVRLAIGSLGFGLDNQNESVQDLVLAQLTGAPGLELVERQSLERVLDELNLSMSGLVRAKDALRAGKLVKADWFLLGSPVNVAGTNSIVLRLVDARTGIMRDAGVFSVDQPATQIAADIARFVRESRENAARPEGHTFLAIGAFEDLSVNRRQAAFPQQLRSYLTAAYHSSGVTLLEREAVDMLLREVRLDLAGLSEGSETNLQQPMQSTYWLVNGAFQSYETTNFQVELDLEIGHAFGRYHHVLLRGKPEESFFGEVKTVIDWQMKTNASAAWPTRNNEARMQMATGRELLHFYSFFDLLLPQNDWNMDMNQAAKRRYNITEAIRAFQTVMLLEPTNREAKMYLAACVRLQSDSRMDEARGYYREIIEEPVRDEFTTAAQQALHWSFDRVDPEEKARWYRSAMSQVTNSEIARNYRDEAEGAEKEIVLNRGGAKAQELQEATLLSKMTNSLMGNVYGEAGIRDYMDSFGTNKSVPAHRLVELYPTFKAKVPSNAVPYLLAAIVAAQVDTNEPVVAEFQQLLDKYADHPDEVSRTDSFWQHIWRPVCDWSFQHKVYRMAATLLEDEIGAIRFDKYHTARIDDDQKMTLGYAYLRLKEWEKALAVFQSYSNRPVQMGSGGPWGEAYSVILTSKQAAYCRQKLGITLTLDPPEFDMGGPLQCMCSRSAFVADDDGLWIGIDGQLLRLTFNLETNLDVRLPVSPSTGISSVSLHASSVWIGTFGEGLIEYDKSTQKCRRFTSNDGLKTESISCAQIIDDKLWIGFGGLDWRGRVDPHGNGVGFLDLLTRKFTSFTQSIAENKESYSRVGTNVSLDSIGKLIPTGIGAIGGRSGDIWFGAESGGLRRYRVTENVWDTPANVGSVSCIAADADRLYIGQSWYSMGDAEGPIGLAFVNLKDMKVQSFGKILGLPAGTVSALALDKNYLWVGGQGFIAMVDVKEQKIRKIAYVQSTLVDRIQIGGGYVWAQFDWHLYRASLKNLE